MRETERRRGMTEAGRGREIRKARERQRMRFSLFRNDRMNPEKEG